LKSFSDQVRLEVHAGKGGNGVITYFTDKTIRRGKPDGGDGGTGGNIIVQAHEALHDLSHLRRKNIHGVEGHNGGIFLHYFKVQEEKTEKMVEKLL
jgi:GTPase